jgi:hypothetical protein
MKSSQLCARHSMNAPNTNSSKSGLAGQHELF